MDIIFSSLLAQFNSVFLFLVETEAKGHTKESKNAPEPGLETEAKGKGHTKDTNEPGKQGTDYFFPGAGSCTFWDHIWGRKCVYGGVCSKCRTSGLEM